MAHKGKPKWVKGLYSVRRQMRSDGDIAKSRGGRKKMMLRTRLLWFTLGFSVTGASIANFVWRDLYGERYAISSDIREKFTALDGRVSSLESARIENLSPAQVES